MTQQRVSARRRFELPMLWLYPELCRWLNASDDRGEQSFRLERLLESQRAPTPELVLLLVVPGQSEAQRVVLDLEQDLERVLKECGSRGGVALLPLPDGPPLEAILRRWNERIERQPELPEAACLIPYFVARTGRTTGAKPVGSPLFLCSAAASRVRESYHNLVRRLHSGRYLLFRLLEHYALAGVDLAREVEMGRFLPAVSSARSAGRGPDVSASIFVVCGIDGSGKSTHVDLLRQFIDQRGLACAVHKIFRHGIFHQTVTELTRQCAENRNLPLWSYQRLIKAFDSLKYYHSAVKPDLRSKDVLLFDRYVYTHYAAGTGRFHHDPFTRELLEIYPTPTRVFLMDLPPRVALTRIANRPERTVDENAYMLGRYREKLLDLAEGEGFCVLDGTDSVEHNQRRIRGEVAAMLAESHG